MAKKTKAKKTKKDKPKDTFFLAPKGTATATAAALIPSVIFPTTGMHHFNH